MSSDKHLFSDLDLESSKTTKKTLMADTKYDIWGFVLIEYRFLKKETREIKILQQENRNGNISLN